MLITELTRQIKSTSRELMFLQRAGVKPLLPENPFTPEDLLFDYSKINPKYHVSENPFCEIVLYKGAHVGCEDSGFLSMALNNGLTGHVLEVRDLVEQGDDDLIRELFDAHTSYYNHTALLSTTFNPELAQTFAPTHPSIARNHNRTIYELKIQANRCVVDCFNTGHCGSNKEIFVLGAIFPGEITSVKIINDDAHSELMSPCGHFIRYEPDKNSINREIKDRNNWRSLCR